MGIRGRVDRLEHRHGRGGGPGRWEPPGHVDLVAGCENLLGLAPGEIDKRAAEVREPPGQVVAGLLGMSVGEFRAALLDKARGQRADGNTLLGGVA